MTTRPLVNIPRGVKRQSKMAGLGVGERNVGQCHWKKAGVGVRERNGMHKCVCYKEKKLSIREGSILYPSQRITFRIPPDMGMGLSWTCI